MLEKYGTHMWTFSWATLTTSVCSGSWNYSVRQSQCLSNTFFLLITHRQAQQQEWCSELPKLSSRSSESSLIWCNSTLWRELAFLAAAVTSPQMFEGLVSLLIQMPQFRTWLSLQTLGNGIQYNIGLSGIRHRPDLDFLPGEAWEQLHSFLPS